MFGLASKNLTRQRPKDAKNSIGNPIGSFRKKNAGLFAMANVGLSADAQYANDVNTIFHELLHLAAYNGNYFSDQLFAQIVHDSPDTAIPYSGEYAVYPVN